MKKQSVFLAVTAILLATLNSCGNYNAKTSNLKNQNDSINYSLGVANGDGLRNYQFQGNVNDETVKAFIDALDKAYKSGVADNENEAYEIGKQFGASIKKQKDFGLMNNPELSFDTELVIQGIVNGANGFDDGSTIEEADQYIQTAIVQMQVRKLQEEAASGEEQE